MDDSKHKIVSLKNLTDGQCLTLKGPAEFRIGLTADDRVACATSEAGNDADEIIVPLVNLTVWSTSGTTVSPGNKDLPIQVNGQTLESEANLLPGSLIEIGDKQLEFSDGPLARPRRRCLPPTPGLPISPTPPPKPTRHSGEDGPGLIKAKPLSVRKQPPLPNDWAVIELPSTDAELLKKTRKPEQLASLASSYVAKHIELHTDARITSDLHNQIFSAMLEVAHHGRSILQHFLTGLIEEQSITGHEDDQPPEPSHGAVIILLREILRQFLDPESLVTVSLIMLRALSHIPGATQLLVDCQVTSAVLGTMAALKSATTVQQYCLDVLAKIALYQPSITEKAPLRESAIDLISLAMEAHPKSTVVAQAACRVLANLATTLYTVISHKLDSYHAVSEELQMFVTGLIAVVDYMFTKSMPSVQSALKRHDHDLTIKTDGRRYLFIYAKLEQLKQRKDLWLTTPPPEEEPPPPLPARTPHSHPHQQHYNSDDDEDPNNSGKGIMKRSRSFENLRSPDRKVTFGEDSAPGSCTSSSSSSPSPPAREGMTEGEENPVEILAQRVITVPQFTDSSPDSPTVPPRTLIGQHTSDSTHTKNIGTRPDAEGSDSPFNHQTEYENWDLLRGVLRRKSALKGHKYLAGDIKFMNLLTKTQVVALVCALAVDGNVREALSLVDRPVSKMVLTTDVPPGIRDFVERQYSTTDTLMDIDPGLMVSIIDAVRYSSLSFEMAQKCVLGVVRALDAEQSGAVVAVTVEFLAATITNRPLQPSMTVPSFVEEVCQELERARKISQNAPALNSLLSEIKLCAKKTSDR
ncbi:uncharacterized protein [Littorina saxatilis]|uniref:Uncharacterized protein n=1 Tax=Littorina saxatilis TaxID=31220 RepID=A0AAN9GBK6_9CAEN